MKLLRTFLNKSEKYLITLIAKIKRGKRFEQESHIYIYIFIYMCVCMCVCIYIYIYIWKEKRQNIKSDWRVSLQG